MDRTASNKFLLYLEPDIKQKSIQPVDDEWTKFMATIIHDAKVGTADYSDPNNPTSEPVFYENDAWRGSHRTPCGNYSDNQDRKLLNGMITNSLAPFYLRWYRSAISEKEWQKIRDLHDFYVRMGFTKAIIEGDDSPIYKDSIPTSPAPEDPKTQVPRQHTFEEEHRVDLADERMLPKEERHNGPGNRPDDFIIEK